MGDTHRNVKFAKFLHSKYPPEKFPVVLVVADGCLELSKIMRSFGYDVVVCEPKVRGKHSIRFKREVRIIKSWFTRDMKVVKPNLIIGMHPDEATIEILLYSVQNDVPCAVVPCCVKGDKKYTACVKNYKEWVQKLKSIGKCDEHRLNINGKNVVLFRGGFA